MTFTIRRLGSASDVSSSAECRKRRTMSDGSWLTFPDGTERDARAQSVDDRSRREERCLVFQSTDRQPRARGADPLRGRPLVRRGSRQLQRHVPQRDACPAGLSAAAPPRGPDRHRRARRSLFSWPAQLQDPEHDRAARGGRRVRTGAPAVVVPAPGRAVPLRPMASRREPRDAAVERADRGPARYARCDRDREGGAATHLREGGPVRSAARTRSGGHSAALARWSSVRCQDERG